MTWTSVAASAKGSSHDDQTPNQDAFRVVDVALPGGGTAVVAAVADGHGGRRYVRSGTGSELAVRLAIEVAAARMSHGAAAPLDSLLEDLVPEVLARWRDEVNRDVAEHPFTAGEAQRAGASLEEQPLIAYGATLLLVVVVGAEVAVAQLGDGDVIVRTAAGSVLQPVPSDDRLVAGETTSLCLPDAESDFRFAFLGAQVGASLVILATDGYGNSFASGEWRDKVSADLAGLVAGETGWANVETGLPDWLAESAQVGGDDVTAVFLINRAQTVETSATAETFPTPQAEPPLVSASRRRSRQVAVVVVAIAALALVWAVVALTGGGNQPAHTRPNPVQLPAGATTTSSALTSSSRGLGTSPDRAQETATRMEYAHG